MGKIRDLLWGDNHRSIVSTSERTITAEDVMKIHEEYARRLLEKEIEIQKLKGMFLEESLSREWYVKEWRKMQDDYRRKLILTMVQSGKYTYNDVVFYADEIINELDRTTTDES